MVKLDPLLCCLGPLRRHKLHPEDHADQQLLGICFSALLKIQLSGFMSISKCYISLDDTRITAPLDPFDSLML